MLNEIIILSIVFLSIIFQSIIGIGVLVLGTPILLILEYNLIEILSILLPFSILTSFINIFLINIRFSLKEINLSNLKLSLDPELKYNFFYICLPSLFVGLLLLKFLQYYLNFKIIIGSIILLSLFIKIFYEKTKLKFSNIMKKIFFFIIGVVHGLTNSGGTLLTIFISLYKKNFKKKSRLSITILYLFLALFQYLIFIFLFKIIPDSTEILIIVILTFVGSVVGNFLIKYISEDIIRLIINFTAFTTALFLIISGLTL